MIVYNITIKITSEIEADWLHWQKQEHIPEVMATGNFTHFHFYRLLQQEDDDGLTFIVQFFANSIEQYQQYIDNNAGHLRQKTMDRWGNRFIAFRTIMQVVD
jgi:hypothetical protein